MKEPPLPRKEQSRLAALKRLNLLDTPLENRFERITRMVSTVLHMPIVAISLIDSQRQWFKSIQGLPVTETSRSVSFCAHTILGDEPLVVPDARKDDRFYDNPLVTGRPEIVFYAGVPLSSSDGFLLGSLCVIDNRPRQLTAQEMQTLRDFAAIVEMELRSSRSSALQADLMEEFQEEQLRGLIDPLTRVWNRTGIQEMLEMMVHEKYDSTRFREDLSVVICNIDQFKKINDTYGNPAGDAVLVEVVKRLLSALREHDMIGRISGDQFLILMPSCPAPELAMITEKMRQHVSESPIRTSAGPLNVTMSLGAIEQGLGDQRDIQSLIKKMDDEPGAAPCGG